MEIILGKEIKLSNISKITTCYRNQVHPKWLNPAVWIPSLGGKTNFSDHLCYSNTYNLCCAGHLSEMGTLYFSFDQAK